MMISKEISYQDLLRSHGLKATTQRLQVLSLLASQKEPMSIAELQQKAKDSTKAETKGHIDTVTLYRSLESLMKSSLVRPVDLRHGHTDYEFVGENAHHHHIVCQNCGAIEDFEWCPEPDFKKKILKSTSRFATLTDHAIEFFGLCKKCNN